MREIQTADITRTVKALILSLGVTLDDGVREYLEQAAKTETLPTAKFALEIMTKNADLAKKTNTPLCQDTGMAVVFVELGQNIVIKGGYIEDAVQQGVREGYAEGYFRKSVLDPLTRKNTDDNTPAVIHYTVKEEDTFRIRILLKGFGSENMSRLFMLTPADGIAGVKAAVLKTVREGGGNPCPPIIVGVGIGGTMEKAALLSKHALLRDTRSLHPDPYLRTLEEELLEDINALGIGVQGLGGAASAVRVFIERYPTHIAGLPVAVTVQCHAVRHGEVML